MAISNKFKKQWRLTFRLYMTFWPAYKAMRSIATGQNVAEKNRTKAVGRLGFFVARAAYWRRSIYRPVMRCFLHPQTTISFQCCMKQQKTCYESVCHGWRTVLHLLAFMTVLTFKAVLYMLNMNTNIGTCVLHPANYSNESMIIQIIWFSW
jgi:hypothetical protein